VAFSAGGDVDVNPLDLTTKEFPRVLDRLDVVHAAPIPIWSRAYGNSVRRDA